MNTNTIQNSNLLENMHRTKLRLEKPVSCFFLKKVVPQAVHIMSTNIFIGTKSCSALELHTSIGLRFDLAGSYHQIRHATITP